MNKAVTLIKQCNQKTMQQPYKFKRLSKTEAQVTPHSSTSGAKFLQSTVTLSHHHHLQSLCHQNFALVNLEWFLMKLKAKKSSNNPTSSTVILEQDMSQDTMVVGQPCWWVPSFLSLVQSLLQFDISFKQTVVLE